MGKHAAVVAHRPTVIDIFHGAGGFSEGFRAAGFQIVGGVEKWKTAVDTFNCNFGLNLKPVDVLRFEGRADLIEELPDTDVIIGSPPCVSFSFSNKLGNADKTMGIRLMKVFLSIVAVKKHKSKSQLKAWYMENVPNSLNSLQDGYSFEELGLSSWCKDNSIAPLSIAIRIQGNAEIIDAADYGAPQARKRLFVHEYLASRGSNLSLLPPKIKTPLSLGETLAKLPSPTCKPSTRKIHDPLYEGIELPLNSLTDHFYETGAYESYWKESRYLKINHPYMGRMGFPEHRDKPSRTIMASLSQSSREAHFYASEWGRNGNGQYRSPTVREAATLMSFPITYQFVGKGIGSKWRLVGNAVCPKVSQALALQLLKKMDLKVRASKRINLPQSLEDIPNLNTFASATYDSPPKRKSNARFRRHPFKKANIAVTLANYNLLENGETDGTWRCYVTYGSGKDHKIQFIDTKQLIKIRSLVESKAPEGKGFVSHITNGFSDQIAPAATMQKLYAAGMSTSKHMNPQRLIERTDEIIRDFIAEDNKIEIGPGLLLRDAIPKSQLFALFAVCQIVHTAESQGAHYE